MDFLSNNFYLDYNIPMTLQMNPISALTIRRPYSNTTNWRIQKFPKPTDPLHEDLILRTRTVLIKAEENNPVLGVPARTYRNNTYIERLHEELTQAINSSVDCKEELTFLLQRGCELGVFPIDHFPTKNISVPLTTDAWLESRRAAFYSTAGAYMNTGYEGLLKEIYTVLIKAQENKPISGIPIQTYQNNSYIEELYRELIQAISLPGVGFPGELATLLARGRELGVFPTIETHLEANRQKQDIPATSDGAVSEGLSKKIADLYERRTHFS